MVRMTIDEVIAHCERTTKNTELIMQKIPDDNKYYWEHKQTAEWLRELKRYKDLEESGRLVVLPCKVGDTVYFLNTKPHISLRMNEVYEAKVVRIVTIGSGSFVMIQMHTEYGCTELPAVKCDFGKTVFLTREEAEAALKGEKNGD